jgi:hypothetical protein
MRRALAGLMQQRSGIILGADADKCSIYGLFIGIAATMSVPNYRRVTCPLAQSVERIHGKENPGRFSSSADQQEQPLVQVNADRSIWIK